MSNYHRVFKALNTKLEKEESDREAAAEASQAKNLAKALPKPAELLNLTIKDAINSVLSQHGLISSIDEPDESMGETRPADHFVSAISSDRVPKNGKSPPGGHNTREARTQQEAASLHTSPSDHGGKSMAKGMGKYKGKGKGKGKANKGKGKGKPPAQDAQSQPSDRGGKSKGRGKGK